MPELLIEAQRPRMARFMYAIGQGSPYNTSRVVTTYIDPTENHWDGPSCWLGRAAPKPTGDPVGTWYNYMMPIWTFDLSALPKDAVILRTYIRFWVDQNFSTASTLGFTAHSYPWSYDAVNPPLTTAPFSMYYPGMGNGTYSWTVSDTGTGWKEYSRGSNQTINIGDGARGEVTPDARIANIMTLFLLPTNIAFTQGQSDSYQRLGLDYVDPVTLASRRPHLRIVYAAQTIGSMQMDNIVSASMNLTIQTAVAPIRYQQTVDSTAQVSLSVSTLYSLPFTQNPDHLYQVSLIIQNNVEFGWPKQIDVITESSMTTVVTFLQLASEIHLYNATPTVLEFDIVSEGQPQAWIYEMLDMGADITTGVLTHAGFGIGGALETGVDLELEHPLTGYVELFLTGYTRGDLRYRVIVRGR